MKDTYVITEGEYSSYTVCFIIQSDRKVEESEFRSYWLEAIKRKTSYVDSKLEEIAIYLGVERQKSVYEYSPIVGWDKFHMAECATGYEYISESAFFRDVLKERGFEVLNYSEINIDYLGEGK